MHSLRNKATHLLRVIQILCEVDEPAGDITQVNARETVHRACVAADLAVQWVRGALLCGRDANVCERPWVERVALVPVVWDALVAVLVRQCTASIALVTEEIHEYVLRQETARCFGAVVCKQGVREHVRAKSKRNTSVRRTEVERIRGDAVFLAVVGVLGEDAGCNVTPRTCVREVEKLLHVLRVGATVGVHFRCQPVTASYAGIALTSEMAVCADSRFIAECVANEWGKGAGLVGMGTDAPAAGDGVAIEESSRSLKENSGCLVEAEGLP